MGHNEKTTVAWQTMALSPLGVWGPVGPGQGQRPAGRTRPAVQGACMTYMTVGLQSQKSQLSPQSEVKVSLATRTLPLSGCGGVTEAETGQSDFQPFHVSQKWLCCGGGAGRGDWGRRGSVSVNQVPLSVTTFPKHLPSDHFGGLSFFPNPEWEQGKDGFNLFMALAALGSGATLRARPPEGEVNSSCHVLTAITGTGEGRRGPSFAVTLDSSASPPGVSQPRSSPIPRGLQVSLPCPSSPPAPCRERCPP